MFAPAKVSWNISIDGIRDMYSIMKGKAKLTEAEWLKSRSFGLESKRQLNKLLIRYFTSKDWRET